MVDWLLDHGVRIALVVVLAFVGYWVVRRSVPRAVALGVGVEPNELAADLQSVEQEKRIETLSHVLVRTSAVMIAAIAALLVLGELGIPLGPLLAGAGVVGIAVGFGAQSLVRDVLGGILILLERQYGRGDVVRVAGIAGAVEDLNLRRTVLRDLDGIVHSIPNGEIRIASNMTRGWSAVNLNISVGYGEDIDRARTVIDRTGVELAAHPEWAPFILEPPSVLRVDGLEESGVALKVVAKTRPMKQWDVAGELRQRLKAAFDAEGIEIPFPHRVVVVRQASDYEGGVGG